jgi:hypothetical protein
MEFPKFAGKTNDAFGFEGGLDRQLLEFVALIDRKYVSTKSKRILVDFAEKTQFFALDAIGDVALGKPFGYLSQDRDLYDYNQINSSSLPVMNIVSVLPWLTKVVHSWPFRLLLPREGDQIGFGRLMRYTTNVCFEMISLLIKITKLCSQDC